jgi:hypothetical protein
MARSKVLQLPELNRLEPYTERSRQCDYDPDANVQSTMDSTGYLVHGYIFSENHKHLHFAHLLKSELKRATGDAGSRCLSRDGQSIELSVLYVLRAQAVINWICTITIIT